MLVLDKGLVFHLWSHVWICYDGVPWWYIRVRVWDLMSNVLRRVKKKTGNILY